MKSMKARPAPRFRCDKLMSTLYGKSRIESVTSAANPLIKDVRRAAHQGGLTENGLCIAESFHLLEEALRSDREIPVVLAADSVRTTVERHVTGLHGTRIVV